MQIIGDASTKDGRSSDIARVRLLLETVDSVANLQLVGINVRAHASNDTSCLETELADGKFYDTQSYENVLSIVSTWPL